MNNRVGHHVALGRSVSPLRRAFVHIRSLTTLALTESLRHPVVLLLTLGAVILTIVMPLLITHNFGEAGRLARDGGLAFQFVFGLFVAGYASASLSRDVESGTISLALSRPVYRELVIVAKFMGITVLIMIFSFSCSLATLIAERVAEKRILAEGGYVVDRQAAGIALVAIAATILAGGWANYKRQRSFHAVSFLLLPAALAAAIGCSSLFSRAGQWAPFRSGFQFSILPASWLLVVALIVVAAIALTASTRLSTTPVLALTVVLFCLGLCSDFWFGSGTSLGARCVYWILPNWQHFWMADALAHGGRIPMPYIARATLYGTTYAAAVLTLGMLLFRNRECK